MSDAGADREYLRAVLAKWRESGDNESALLSAYTEAQQTIATQAELLAERDAMIIELQATIEGLQTTQPIEPMEATDEQG
jgi:hypothetical protein